MNPELEFISKILTHLSLGDFNLRGVRDLFFDLGDPADLSSKNIKDCLHEALREHGEKNIAPELLEIKVGGYNSDIKCRPVKLYLNDAFIAHMMQLAKEIEQLHHDVGTPLSPIPRDPMSTEDKKLLQLREAAADYKLSLPAIEAKEQRFFAKRSEQVLERRRHALAMLEAYLHGTSIVTPGIMQVVGVLITDIKTHTPQWKELHLFRQGLDVVSFGVHAVIRYGLFKPHQSAVNLHDAILEKQSKSS